MTPLHSQSLRFQVGMSPFQALISGPHTILLLVALMRNRRISDPGLPQVFF